MHRRRFPKFTAYSGESVKSSVESTIKRLVKVGARVVYHAVRWLCARCVGSSIRPLASHSISLSRASRHGGTNSSTGEEIVCPGLEKSAPFTFNLCTLLRKCMILGLQERTRGFQVKIRFQQTVWMQSVAVEALLRGKSLTKGKIG